MSNKTVNIQYMVDERCASDKTGTLLVVLPKKERSSKCRALKESSGGWVPCPIPESPSNNLKVSC